jgi:hypothetical protein
MKRQESGQNENVYGLDLKIAGLRTGIKHYELAAINRYQAGSVERN